MVGCCLPILHYSATITCMSENTEKNSNHWQELADTPVLRSTEKAQPVEMKVKLTHGVWFGTAMGIGFAIGFLVSFLILVGIVGFFVYSRFPGLFS